VLALAPGLTIGSYRLIEPAGAGGMAEVWRAYQPRLERFVAIKFLSPRYASDPSYLERFLREARAVSRLDHPNILTILDYGEYGGWTYMVSPFIGGGTLADRLRRGPWSVPEAVAVLDQLAAALDHAHAAGIIHRDIKPSNVLFTEHGRLVLSDFGVARMVEGTTALSQAGLVIGTPMYMSPEQADGEKAGPASDLYSLGVIAYQMLTGRPPFMADTPLALLRAHIDRPLQPPRTLNPHLTETVEAALFKVMAKAPADRYASATDFVLALQAEPSTRTMTQATLPGQTLPTFPADAVRRAGQHDGAARSYPSGQLHTPPPHTPRPYVPSPHTPPPSVPRPPTQTLTAARTRTTATPRVTRRQAIIGIGGVLVAAVGGGAAVWAASSATRPTMGPAPTATVPQLPLVQAPPTSTVSAKPTVAVTPLAVAPLAPPSVPTAVPNPPTAVPTTVPTISPTEPPAPTPTQTGVVASAPAAPAPPQADQTAPRVLAEGTGEITSVAYSPDGTMLASASSDTTVRLWNVADGTIIRALQGHTDAVDCVAFSPDGQILASGSNDQAVRLWNVADGSPIRVMSGHTGTVISMCFSPDGQLLASSSVDKTVQVWRVADGAPVRTLNGHADPVIDVTFSPDGQLITSSSYDGTIRVWQVADGKQTRTLFGHDGPITGVAYSPDGRLLASSSTDMTLRLWRVSDWLRIKTLRGHTASVSSLGFSPDGQTLVSGSADKTARLWRVSDGSPLQTLTGHADAINSVRFAPGGQLVASGSSDLTVRLWRVSQ
jgi:WD40 repeat protein/serine/threonine protein kinase